MKGACSHYPPAINTVISRPATSSGSTTTYTQHLCVGATDSQVRPVKTATINGTTVRVGSPAHAQLISA